MKNYNFQDDYHFLKMPFLTNVERRIIEKANEGKTQKEVAYELSQSLITMKRRFARLQKIYEVYSFFQKRLQKIRDEAEI